MKKGQFSDNYRIETFPPIRPKVSATTDSTATVSSPVVSFQQKTGSTKVTSTLSKDGANSQVPVMVVNPLQRTNSELNTSSSNAHVTQAATENSSSSRGTLPDGQTVTVPVQSNLIQPSGNIIQGSVFPSNIVFANSFHSNEGISERSVMLGSVPQQILLPGNVFQGQILQANQSPVLQGNTFAGQGGLVQGSSVQGNVVQGNYTAGNFLGSSLPIFQGNLLQGNTLQGSVIPTSIFQGNTSQSFWLPNHFVQYNSNSFGTPSNPVIIPPATAVQHASTSLSERELKKKEPKLTKPVSEHDKQFQFVLEQDTDYDKSLIAARFEQFKKQQGIEVSTSSECVTTKTSSDITAGTKNSTAVQGHLKSEANTSKFVGVRSASCGSPVNVASNSSQGEQTDQQTTDSIVSAGEEHGTDQFQPKIAACYSMKKLSLTTLMTMLSSGEDILSSFLPGTKEFYRASTFCDAAKKFSVFGFHSDIPEEFYHSLITPYFTVNEVVVLKLHVQRQVEKQYGKNLDPYEKRKDHISHEKSVSYKSLFQQKPDVSKQKTGIEVSSKNKLQWTVETAANLDPELMSYLDNSEDKGKTEESSAGVAAGVGVAEIAFAGKSNKKETVRKKNLMQKDKVSDDHLEPSSSGVAVTEVDLTEDMSERKVLTGLEKMAELKPCQDQETGDSNDNSLDSEAERIRRAFTVKKTEGSTSTDVTDHFQQVNSDEEMIRNAFTLPEDSAVSDKFWPCLPKTTYFPKTTYLPKTTKKAIGQFLNKRKRATQMQKAVSNVTEIVHVAKESDPDSSSGNLAVSDHVVKKTDVVSNKASDIVEIENAGSLHGKAAETHMECVESAKNCQRMNSEQRFDGNDAEESSGHVINDSDGDVEIIESDKELIDLTEEISDESSDDMSSDDNKFEINTFEKKWKCSVIISNLSPRWKDAARKLGTKSVLQFFSKGSFKLIGIMLRYCYLCGREFLDATEVWAHVINQHAKVELTSASENEFLCSHCYRPFNHIIEVIRHELEIHLSDNPCFFCGLSLDSREEMLKHIASVHSELFHCVFCAGQFVGQQSYSDHMVSVHKRGFSCEVKAVSYVCLFCSLKFAKQTSLETHMDNVHLYGVIYSKESVCVSCGHNFLNTSALFFHRSEKARCWAEIQPPSQISLAELCHEIVSQKMNRSKKTTQLISSSNADMEKAKKRHTYVVRPKQTADESKEMAKKDEQRRKLNLKKVPLEPRHVSVKGKSVMYSFKEFVTYCYMDGHIEAEDLPVVVDTLVKYILHQFPHMHLEGEKRNLYDLSTSLSRTPIFSSVLELFDYEPLPWNNIVKHSILAFLHKLEQENIFSVSLSKDKGSSEVLKVIAFFLRQTLTALEQADWTSFLGSDVTPKVEMHCLSNNTRVVEELMNNTRKNLKVLVEAQKMSRMSLSDTFYQEYTSRLSDYMEITAKVLAESKVTVIIPAITAVVPVTSIMTVTHAVVSSVVPTTPTVSSTCSAVSVTDRSVFQYFPVRTSILPVVSVSDSHPSIVTTTDIVAGSIPVSQQQNLKASASGVIISGQIPLSASVTTELPASTVSMPSFVQWGTHEAESSQSFNVTPVDVPTTQKGASVVGSTANQPIIVAAVPSQTLQEQKGVIPVPDNFVRAASSAVQQTMAQVKVALIGGKTGVIIPSSQPVPVHQNLVGFRLIAPKLQLLAENSPGIRSDQHSNLSLSSNRDGKDHIVVKKASEQVTINSQKQLAIVNSQLKKSLSTLKGVQVAKKYRAQAFKTARGMRSKRGRPKKAFLRSIPDMQIPDETPKPYGKNLRKRNPGTKYTLEEYTFDDSDEEALPSQESDDSDEEWRPAVNSSSNSEDDNEESDSVSEDTNEEKSETSERADNSGMDDSYLENYEPVNSELVKDSEENEIEQTSANRSVLQSVSDTENSDHQQNVNNCDADVYSQTRGYHSEQKVSEKTKSGNAVPVHVLKQQHSMFLKGGMLAGEVRALDHDLNVDSLKSRWSLEQYVDDKTTCNENNGRKRQAVENMDQSFSGKVIVIEDSPSSLKSCSKKNPWLDRHVKCSFVRIDRHEYAEKLALGLARLTDASDFTNRKITRSFVKQICADEISPKIEEKDRAFRDLLVSSSESKSFKTVDLLDARKPNRSKFKHSEKAELDLLSNVDRNSETRIATKCKGPGRPKKYKLDTDLKTGAADKSKDKIVTNDNIGNICIESQDSTDTEINSKNEAKRTRGRPRKSEKTGGHKVFSHKKASGNSDDTVSEKKPGRPKRIEEGKTRENSYETADDKVCKKKLEISGKTEQSKTTNECGSYRTFDSVANQVQKRKPGRPKRSTQNLETESDQIQLNMHKSVNGFEDSSASRDVLDINQKTEKKKDNADKGTLQGHSCGKKLRPRKKCIYTEESTSGDSSTDAEMENRNFYGNKDSSCGLVNEESYQRICKTSGLQSDRNSDENFIGGEGQRSHRDKSSSNSDDEAVIRVLQSFGFLKETHGTHVTVAQAPVIYVSSGISIRDDATKQTHMRKQISKSEVTVTASNENESLSQVQLVETVSGVRNPSTSATSIEPVCINMNPCIRRTKEQEKDLERDVLQQFYRTVGYRKEAEAASAQKQEGSLTGIKTEIIDPAYSIAESQGTSSVSNFNEAGHRVKMELSSASIKTTEATEIPSESSGLNLSSLFPSISRSSKTEELYVCTRSSTLPLTTQAASHSETVLSSSVPTSESFVTGNSSCSMKSENVNGDKEKNQEVSNGEKEKDQENNQEVPSGDKENNQEAPVTKKPSLPNILTKQSSSETATKVKLTRHPVVLVPVNTSLPRTFGMTASTRLFGPAPSTVQAKIPLEPLKFSSTAKSRTRKSKPGPSRPVEISFQIPSAHQKSLGHTTDSLKSTTLKNKSNVSASLPEILMAQSGNTGGISVVNPCGTQNMQLSSVGQSQSTGNLTIVQLSGTNQFALLSAPLSKSQEQPGQAVELPQRQGVQQGAAIAQPQFLSNPQLVLNPQTGQLQLSVTPAVAQNQIQPAGVYPVNGQMSQPNGNQEPQGINVPSGLSVTVKEEPLDSEQNQNQTTANASQFSVSHEGLSAACEPAIQTSSNDRQLQFVSQPCLQQFAGTSAGGTYQNNQILASPVGGIQQTLRSGQLTQTARPSTLQIPVVGPSLTPQMLVVEQNCPLLPGQLVYVPHSSQVSLLSQGAVTPVLQGAVTPTQLGMTVPAFQGSVTPAQLGTSTSAHPGPITPIMFPQIIQGANTPANEGAAASVNTGETTGK